MNRKLTEEQIQLSNCLQIPSISAHTCPLTPGNGVHFSSLESALTLLLALWSHVECHSHNEMWQKWCSRISELSTSLLALLNSSCHVTLNPGGANERSHRGPRGRGWWSFLPQLRSMLDIPASATLLNEYSLINDKYICSEEMYFKK